MKLASCQQVRQAECNLFKSGDCSSLELMDRVIARMARAWRDLSFSQPFTWVIVYAGSGNNAGDAIGLAARLDLPICLRLAVANLSPDSQIQLERAERKGLVLRELPRFSAMDSLLLIDGLLGSGARGELRPAYCALVDELNALRCKHARSCTLSMDIPSGMDAQSGACMPLAVRADVTACIACVKPGLLVDESTRDVGRLLPISLPEVEDELEAQSEALLLEPSLLSSWVSPRDYECFKNRVGHVHILAGSRGMLGAAQMAGEAAIWTGAGLVTLHVAEEDYDVMAARVSPEIMVNPVKDYAELDFSSAASVLIGPGLSLLSTRSCEAIMQLIADLHIPLVLDAGALRLIAEYGCPIPELSVLTPHVGEMRALMDPAGRSRLAWASDFVDAHPCTLVLKGARSLIVSQEGVFYNSTGGPFMANGGQGDTLAGCIAALAAEALPLHHAAAMGAWLCGRAAELARCAHGMSPSLPASCCARWLPAARGEIS